MSTRQTRKTKKSSTSVTTSTVSTHKKSTSTTTTASKKSSSQQSRRRQRAKALSDIDESNEEDERPLPSKSHQSKGKCKAKASSDVGKTDDDEDEQASQPPKRRRTQDVSQENQAIDVEVDESTNVRIAIHVADEILANKFENYREWSYMSNTKWTYQIRSQSKRRQQMYTSFSLLFKRFDSIRKSQARLSWSKGGGVTSASTLINFTTRIIYY